MGAVRSVLIVTGSDQTRRMYAEYLVWRGIEVREVGTAAAAIRTLASIRPDAVVTDDRLPDSTGSDLGRALRRCRATFDLPLLLLSSDTFGGQPARHDGCDRVLVVPLLPESLYDALQAIVSECRGRDRRFESWLFTRAGESVWMVRTENLELSIAGPGRARDIVTFDRDGDLRAFQAEYGQRLSSAGFVLQAAADDRRSGRDRRRARRPSGDRRTLH
jgi:DNA-binding response OmpR family regulator